MSTITRDGELVASTEAYVKAVLHALKYPSQPVCGLLLGRSEAQFEGQSSPACPVVLDAIPLFHTVVASAPNPVLDAALSVMQAVAKEEHHEIIGLYFASERLQDHDAPPTLAPVLKLLLQQQTGKSGLVLWCLDNACLTFPPRVPCIASVSVKSDHPVMHEKSTTATRLPLPLMGGHNVTFVSPAVEPEERPKDNIISARRFFPKLRKVDVVAVAEFVQACVSAHAHHYIADFEDHLEEPQLPFADQPLSGLLKQELQQKVGTK